MWFSASGSTMTLVSGEVKFIQTFAGNHPARVVISHNLETVHDRM